MSSILSPSTFDYTRKLLSASLCMFFLRKVLLFVYYSSFPEPLHFPLVVPFPKATLLPAIFLFPTVYLPLFQKEEDRKTP